MISHKHADADLARGYYRLLGYAIGLSAALHAVLFVLIPDADFGPPRARPAPQPITLESVPASDESVNPSPSGDWGTARPVARARRRVVRPPAPPLAATQYPVEAEEAAAEYWMLEKQPQVLRRVLPEYPDSARRALVEGRVYVRILLDRRGRVERVGETTGPAPLRAAAILAARQWEFTPAVQNDRTVKVWISLPFAFQLE